jgi:hypothetical protein
MALQKVLQRMFSGDAPINREALQLQREYGRLKDCFKEFAKNLAKRIDDPQFFAEMVKVDVENLDQNFVTLTVLGGKELTLCFDVIRHKSDIVGQVICFSLPVYEKTQKQQHVRRTELGRWTFGGNGDTEINITDGPLNMNQPKEAVALVVGLILAAYSAAGDQGK